MKYYLEILLIMSNILISNFTTKIFSTMDEDEYSMQSEPYLMPKHKSVELQAYFIQYVDKHYANTYNRHKALQGHVYFHVHNFQKEAY